MGGTAGRKRAAGNREEEEAAQGRKAGATGQGGWAENKLQFRREAVTETGMAAPTTGYSFSLWNSVPHATAVLQGFLVCVMEPPQVFQSDMSSSKASGSQ